MKIFESVEDKVKHASVSLREQKFSFVFHNLNMALEMVLKQLSNNRRFLKGLSKNTLSEKGYGDVFIKS